MTGQIKSFSIFLHFFLREAVRVWGNFQQRLYWAGPFSKIFSDCIELILMIEKIIQEALDWFCFECFHVVFVIVKFGCSDCNEIFQSMVFCSNRWFDMDWFSILFIDLIDVLKNFVFLDFVQSVVVVSRKSEQLGICCKLNLFQDLRCIDWQDDKVFELVGFCVFY
jgi:hypothetical protein